MRRDQTVKRVRVTYVDEFITTCMIAPDSTVDDDADTWVLAGDVAEMAVWDIANRAKDRDDERLDAMRVHNGMTLDEFLAHK